jgi:hypothetical protein
MNGERRKQVRPWNNLNVCNDGTLVKHIPEVYSSDAGLWNNAPRLLALKFATHSNVIPGYPGSESGVARSGIQEFDDVGAQTLSMIGFGNRRLVGWR